MKAFKIIILLFAVSLLGGCIDADLKIKLRPDGSGQIVEKIIINKAFVNMMKEIAAQFGSDEKFENFQMFTEEEMAARAAEIGAGVKFLSGELISDENGSGYSAVYEFDDIVAIQLDEDPMGHLPDEAQEMSGGEQSTDQLKFSFTPGDVATLTIEMNEDLDLEDDNEPVEKEESQEENPMEQKVFEMLKNLKTSIQLEILGDIVETNASFRDGNIVTLLDMDFGKIMENEEAFEKLTKYDIQSFDQMKKLMEEYEGFKVDMNKQIVIKFE